MSNNYIKQRLKDFAPSSLLEKQNAFKQVIQEIVLNCLEKVGFFKVAAFNGGTCLRIFYGLNRFSEDLDFSLIKPSKNFNLSKYFKPFLNYLKAFGLEFSIEKYKPNIIQSAFLKGNTKIHMLRFFDNFNTNKVRDNEITRIKFEVDTNPPDQASFKELLLDKPINSFIKTYDPSTLFASKVNAILSRNWIKGRDLYDYMFYIDKGIALNLNFLKNALVQFNGWNKEKKLTINNVKTLLLNKFKTINYELAKQDVIHFIKDEKDIEGWNAKLFEDTIDKIK